MGASVDHDLQVMCSSLIDMSLTGAVLTCHTLTPLPPQKQHGCLGNLLCLWPLDAPDQQDWQCMSTKAEQAMAELQERWRDKCAELGDLRENLQDCMGLLSSVSLHQNRRIHQILLRFVWLVAGLGLVTLVEAKQGPSGIQSSQLSPPLVIPTGAHDPCVSHTHLLLRLGSQSCPCRLHLIRFWGPVLILGSCAASLTHKLDAANFYWTWPQRMRCSTSRTDALLNWGPFCRFITHLDPIATLLWRVNGIVLRMRVLHQLLMTSLVELLRTTSSCIVLRCREARLSFKSTSLRNRHLCSCPGWTVQT